MTINPHLYKNIGYDTLRDFAPITNIHTVSYVFCVNPSLQVNGVPGLIALAKRRPGEVTYGSAGNGSTSHLAQAMFASAAGISVTHVPYKGAGASLTDLIGGQITLVAEVTPAVLPHVKAGKIRAIGISSAKRLVFLPDVPTVQEQGVPGYDVVAWTGIVAPTGTPEPILERLNTEIVNILKTPDVQKRLYDLGMVPVGNSREQFGAFLKSELAKWKQAVMLSGARIE
jgi:tripartite-type tricarboxylate transporter receptor subunit TctC